MNKSKNAQVDLPAWKVGDKVAWSSQAAGGTKVKVGVIKEIIPARGATGHEYAVVDTSVSYPVTVNTEIGKCMGATFHRTPKPYKPMLKWLGRPSKAELAFWERKDTA